MGTQIDNRGRQDAQGVLAPTVEFLRQFAPFDQMTTSHIEFLAKHLRLGFYPRGETIVSSNRAPHTFYIVKQGRVRVAAEDATSSREFGPGGCFPLADLLARRPVDTVQRAAEDTFCFELDWENFEKLVAQSHAFRNFCLQAPA